jgi:hypothetical protein
MPGKLKAFYKEKIRLLEERRKQVPKVNILNPGMRSSQRRGVRSYRDRGGGSGLAENDKESWKRL